LAATPLRDTIGHALDQSAMSRADQRAKRKQRRKERRAVERAMVEQIDALLPMGCCVTAIGPSAVGVQGDARTYGLSVIVNFPLDTTKEQILDVSTLITNRVGRVTRVLMDIPI
jgi:hypothetical protein